jgi:hypothetical protein
LEAADHRMKPMRQVELEETLLLCVAMLVVSRMSKNSMCDEFNAGFCSEIVNFVNLMRSWYSEQTSEDAVVSFWCVSIVQPIELCCK